MLTMQIIHTYQILVEDGIAEPILCLEGDVMLPFEFDEEPAFWCPVCDQITRPGLELETKITSWLP
jgi:hypothetical protein